MRLSLFFVFFSCVAINLIQLANTSPLFDTKSPDVKRQDFNMSIPDVWLNEGQNMESINIQLGSVSIAISGPLLSELNMILDRVIKTANETAESFDLNPLLTSAITPFVEVCYLRSK
ncbi:hypothetical protein FRC09_005768 [Ceratobasidium sp. 395]|nr:hypothetical protein FRC09_005768 [Ceratobasidium sp. 395]